MPRPNRSPISNISVLLLLLTFSFTAPLPVWSEFKLVEGPTGKDPVRVHHYELANGLQVFLTENHDEPRFYAEIIVRAGGKHDPAESTGIAHYLEHMLFKGTDRMGTLDYEAEKAHLDKIDALYEQHAGETDPEKRKEIYGLINAESQLASKYAIPNEIDRAYAAMGERHLNAHTSVEETVYMVSLPSNRLEHWARLEAERFRQPVFRLFQTELETVYEEKNRSTDNKRRIISEAVKQVLFKEHPYGQQTILGSVEHLKNPSLKRMYEFFETYYVPNNMAIALSGDIDIPTTIALIDAHFSIWQPGKLPKPTKWKEKSLKGAERVEVSYPGEEYVLLAFRTPANRHKDAEALAVLDMILDNRVAGLINLNLQQQQRVRDAGSYPYQDNDYSAQYLWGIPKQDQPLEEVERLLLEQLDIIKKGDFEDWIIPAIVTDFRKTYKAKLERNTGRVELLRHAFVEFEEWEHALGELERMGKLKKKHIVKVAKKYFKDDYVAAYRRDGEQDLPSIEKPALDAIEIDPSRESRFMADTMALPFEEIEPSYVVPGRDFKMKEVRDGVMVYHSANPVNDLFSLSVNIELGTLADNRLAVARELMDKSGTPRFNAEELKKEWYRLGTDFSISTGDHRASISISGLDENFAASLALAMEVVREPTVGPGVWEKLVPIILKRRADAMTDNRTISGALYRYNRWGDDAPYMRILPNDAVEKLDPESMHALIGSLLDYEATVTYTGSLPMAQVMSELAEYYGDQFQRRQPPSYRTLSTRRPDATEVYFLHREMAQAMVRIEIGNDAYSESDLPATELYNEYIGGMSGIIFQELREARALAYSAGARYFTGRHKLEENLMIGGIGCQADKTGEAVTAFVELLDQLPTSEQRFADAQRAQIQQYRTSHLGFRQVLSSVLTWERQGVAVDPRGWRYDQLRQANADVMMEFQAEHLAGRPKLISIVGDRSKIDMEALGTVGKVVELQVEDIFGF